MYFFSWRMSRWVIQITMKNIMLGVKEIPHWIGLEPKQVKEPTKTKKQRVHRWLGPVTNIQTLDISPSIRKNHQWFLWEILYWFYCFFSYDLLGGVITTGWLNSIWTVPWRSKDGLGSKASWKMVRLTDCKVLVVGSYTKNNFHFHRTRMGEWCYPVRMFGNIGRQGSIPLQESRGEMRFHQRIRIPVQ